MTWIYHERTDLDRERAYQEWVSSGMGEGEFMSKPMTITQILKLNVQEFLSWFRNELIAEKLLGGILAIAASAGFWAFMIWAGTRLWRH